MDPRSKQLFDATVADMIRCGWVEEKYENGERYLRLTAAGHRAKARLLGKDKRRRPPGHFPRT
jgi:hypothetical protein